MRLIVLLYPSLSLTSRAKRAGPSPHLCPPTERSKVTKLRRAPRPTHAAHWALHGRRRPTAGGAELGARVTRRVRVVVNLAWFEVARATRPPA